ncbi:MAG: recombinase family protein [Candidatus Eisenbacteria bacterium]|nr:recombinase family protein [Candidatus Eisenbacteria bacterium]
MTIRNRTKTPKKTVAVRCAIYTRKSTDEGLDSDFNSLDAQREAAEAYIASQKAEGWTFLPDRYDDGGFSGGTMDRPALRQLLADVEAGKIDCVVVYKVDRLSRSLLDFSRIIEILDKHGVSFVSVTQQFATNTSIGRLTLNMLFSFAQFEREIISERTSDKMSAARRKGKWIGGIPVLGYDIDPAGGRLVVNEEEAARVRAIFDLYLEKESLLETVRELNRRRWTTKRWTTKKGLERGGVPFEKGNFSRMLTNIVYIGNIQHRGSVYPGEHEAIVDEKVWQRVQKMLGRNGTAGGRASRNKYNALLRGILWCTPCETAMYHTYTNKGDRRYRYYVCGQAQKNGRDSCPTKSIPAGEIERFVVERIRCIGTDPKLQGKVLETIRANVKGQLDEFDRERRTIAKDLRRWSTEVKRLVGPSSKGQGQKSRPTKLVDLQERIEAEEARLGEISRRKAELESEQVDEKDLAAALESFAPIWDSLSPREQARAVQLLVERVGYDGETLAITFRPTGIKALSQEGAP